MEVNGLGPVSGGSPIRRTPQSTPSANTPPVNEPRPVSPTDELDLSSVDAASNQVDLQGEFRSQRLARIQEQIANGTYETPQKLNIAVDRMVEQLTGE